MESNRKRRVEWVLQAALREARHLAGDEHLCRIALALYDHQSQLVTSFVHSGEGDTGLDHFKFSLDEQPILAAMAVDGLPHVVQDLADDAHAGTHGVALMAAGFRSCLTIPLAPGGVLSGFVFFNATVPGLFTPEVVERQQAFLADLPRFLLRELEREV